MAIQRPARLEQNRHGVFVLRLVVPVAHRDADGRPREVRISLRTRDPARARVLALQLNADIERLRLERPTIDPRQLLLQHQLQTSGLGFSSAASLGTTHSAMTSTTQSIDAVAPRVRLSPGETPSLPVSASSTMPASTPTKLKFAIEAFVRSRAALAQNRRNTGLEKQRSLSLLMGFLRERGISDAEASVASLTRTMLIDFVAAYSSREGKFGTGSLSARTVVKLLGHLAEFIDYLMARGDLETSPMDATFDRTVAGLRARASQVKGRRNYRPFAEDDLRRIFEPRRYLQHNSAADDFWVPLLGLFTGARLGELVSLMVADVLHDPLAGVHLIQVQGKNENSRRAVPLAQPLIDLGFLDYVAHIGRLGWTPLFPNRPMNPTREADPSKHLSRSFGEHLDRVGLTDPLHVFHSFRHTVISRMHVCGVPVGDAELIVGHAAQDAAVRADAARSHAGRNSVHLGTYTHADSYSVSGETVMARLKRRLDESLTFQIDIQHLGKAASIVLSHTREVRLPNGSKAVQSGWHTNAKAACERALAELES